MRALQTDIGHFSHVFTTETSGAEIAITEAVTTGRHPQGPLVPLWGSLPSGQSLSPSSGSKKKAKKHMCEDCGKECSKLSDMKDHQKKINILLKVMNSKHKNQFIHNCDKWGYGTNNKQSMTSHKIREHTSKEVAQPIEKFCCSICNK